MNRRIHVEVTDRFGTVAQILDPDKLLGRLRPRQRAQLGALVDGLIRDLMLTLGWSEDHARKVAAATLMRLAADEAAYERVAERRGLLPL